MVHYTVKTLNFFSMNKKTQTKAGNKGKTKKDIGIFNSFDKEETPFFEQPDNSWWWTYTLFLIILGLISIWALATFSSVS